MFRQIYSLALPSDIIEMDKLKTSLSIVGNPVHILDILFFLF